MKLNTLLMRLRREPGECPKCKGPVETGVIVEDPSDPLTLFRYASCEDCDFEWAEYYTLSRAHEA